MYWTVTDRCTEHLLSHVLNSWCPMYWTITVPCTEQLLAHVLYSYWPMYCKVTRPCTIQLLADVLYSYWLMYWIGSSYCLTNCDTLIFKMRDCSILVQSSCCRVTPYRLSEVIFSNIYAAQQTEVIFCFYSSFNASSKRSFCHEIRKKMRVSYKL